MAKINQFQLSDFQRVYYVDENFELVSDRRLAKWFTRAGSLVEIFPSQVSGVSTIVRSTSTAGVPPTDAELRSAYPNLTLLSELAEGTDISVVLSDGSVEHWEVRNGSLSLVYSQSSSQTDLGVTVSPLNVVISSSSGADATIPLATSLAAGAMSPSSVNAIADHQALLGMPDGSQNLGAFSGVTIADNQSVKSALQALETAIESASSGAANLSYTASPTNGVVVSSSGTDATIPLGDGTNAGLMSPAQSLKLANITVTQAVDLDAIELDVSQHQSLLGVPDGSVDLGTFTGSTIADSSTVKSALQAIETAVESLGSVTGVYVGSAATLAALNALPHGNGDWAILSVDDGANQRGIYVGNGTAFSLAAEIPDLLYASNAEVLAATESAKVVSPLSLASAYTQSSVYASTANGNGASLVGVEDAGGLYAATTVESALSEVMGDLNATQTAIGVADGELNLGTFTGTTIPDNQTAKGAIQSLETAVESRQPLDADLTAIAALTTTAFGRSLLEVADAAAGRAAISAADATTLASAVTDISEHQSLLGMPDGSTNLGTFTGATIADNSSVKSALQSLETAVESASGATNLSYTASPTDGIVASSTGTDATVPLGTGTNAGLLAPAQFTKLSHISVTQAVDLDAIEADVSEHQSLFGMPDGSTHLGTFTGTTIPDNASVKSALQQLETSLESVASAGLPPLASGSLFVGNVSNVATATAVSGDATLSNTGVLTVVSASETAAGKVELATSAETIAGTSTTLAVTPSGAAAAYQPLDADLTSIAALTTTGFGRGLLELADAAAARTAIGAGTSNFDGAFSSLTGTPTTLAGYGIADAITATAVAAGYQPLDSDLTAIAALTTTAFGRSLLEVADAAAGRAALGAAEATVLTAAVTDISEHQSLFGMPDGSIHLGTFTGTTIADNVSVKAALQALETAVEAASGSGVSDGDKGDIVVSGSGATWTIDAASVTNAKMADVATATIKGRVSVGTGSPEDLTPAQVRTMINVADGANNYVHPNHSGDVTSTGDGATVIAGSAVTTAKIANSAVTTAKIANSAVTNAKLANMAAVTVKANTTGASAAPTDFAIGTDQLLVNTGGALVSQKITPHRNVTPSVLTLTDSATISWNLANGLFAQVTLAGNRTLAAPTGLTAGQTMMLVVNQDGTGGRTLTWNSAYKFAGGTAPTLTAAGGARDVFYLSSVDGSTVIVSSMLDVK